MCSGGVLQFPWNKTLEIVSREQSCHFGQIYIDLHLAGDGIILLTICISYVGRSYSDCGFLTNLRVSGGSHNRPI